MGEIGEEIGQQLGTRPIDRLVGDRASSVISVDGDVPFSVRQAAELAIINQHAPAVAADSMPEAARPGFEAVD